MLGAGKHFKLGADRYHGLRARGYYTPGAGDTTDKLLAGIVDWVHVCVREHVVHGFVQMLTPDELHVRETDNTCMATKVRAPRVMYRLAAHFSLPLTPRNVAFRPTSQTPSTLSPLPSCSSYFCSLLIRAAHCLLEA